MQARLGGGTFGAATFLASLPLLAALVLPAQAEAQDFFLPAPGSPFGAGDGAISVAIGDFDGDENPDLAVANVFSDDVSVLLGDGAGGFTEAAASPFGAGEEPFSIAIGDLNADGNPDLATANRDSDDVTVLLGDGAGGFTEAAASPFGVGESPTSVAIGDLNSDGDPDLATANASSRNVSVLLGDGAGGFIEASPVLVGVGPQSVAIGDLNSDGDPDLATANLGSNDVTVLLGDGAGGFTSAAAFPAGDPISIAIGALNSDGDPDLAIANVGDDDDVTVLLGDGAGGFTEAPTSPFGVGDGPTSVAIGDLNSDGDPDLATANQGSDSVTVLIGDGEAAFVETGPSPFGVGDAARSVAIGNLDSDGDPDLATANVGSDNVSVLLNGLACTISGTPGDDVLIGTGSSDVICAGEGNDTLRGRGGPDALVGDAGDDVLVGQRDDDFLDGGPGIDRIGYSNHATGGINLNLATGVVTGPNLGTDMIAQNAAGSTVEDADGTPFADTLRGDGKDNRLKGAGGADTLIGGSGDDLLRGQSGADELQGNGGGDELHGDGEADELQGDGGADELQGDGARDQLKPGAGDDPEVFGGAGSDTVLYDDIRGGGVMVDLAAGTASPLAGSDSGTDALAEIEHASGSPGGDLLSAVIAATASLLRGGSGDDSLDAADGDSLDTIRGGGGVDSCVADGGDLQFSCP